MNIDTMTFSSIDAGVKVYLHQIDTSGFWCPVLCWVLSPGLPGNVLEEKTWVGGVGTVKTCPAPLGRFLQGRSFVFAALFCSCR